MSKLSNLIFHNAQHNMSSPYGKRNSIQTSAGSTGTFHNGTDYATYGVKLPQYAIESGEVLSCGTDWAYGGAKYVWVKYPRIGVKMLHYHLDSISVKKGQSVNKNTIIGYTGKTGKATGIHLHLEIKDLKTNSRYDPEKFSETYTEPTEKSKTSFLPEKGFFARGDKGKEIEKINEFYYNVFPAYAKTLKRNKKDVRGYLFGENTLAWTNEFKRRLGKKQNGIIDAETLADLESFGFKY